ncbi:MAG: hypothetical protein ACI39Q_04230 [Wujia sp.]
MNEGSDSRILFISFKGSFLSTFIKFVLSGFKSFKITDFQGWLLSPKKDHKSDRYSRQDYTYDVNGNRETATFANGVVLIYIYDDMNRLITQKTVDSLCGM